MWLWDKAIEFEDINKQSCILHRSKHERGYQWKIKEKKIILFVTRGNLLIRQKACQDLQWQLVEDHSFPNQSFYLAYNSCIYQHGLYYPWMNIFLYKTHKICIVSQILWESQSSKQLEYTGKNFSYYKSIIEKSVKVFKIPVFKCSICMYIM